MSGMRLFEVARAAEGRLVGPDCTFDGVTTDSRSVSPGQLFVALAGPRFDGHEFVAQAVSDGAVAALVSREIRDCTVPQVVVADTRVALGAYARWWRARFDLTVVGVTGSNGKTTVKEMVAAILRERGPVLATRGNLNNDIGVPLMLLELESTHDAAVIEMGANHRGEIRQLAALAAPSIGIVTNAGPAHLEGFGGLDGVAHGKGELYQSLPAGGCAVINANDAYAPLWRGLASRCRRIEFGIDVDADYRIDAAGIDDDGTSQRFTIEAPAGAIAIELPVPGRHNARNAVGAVAAACVAGASSDDARAGLARFRPVGGRLRSLRAAGGAAVIDDTYNANPASLDAALQVVARLPGRRWLVLGDMLELGDDASALHAEGGRRARELGFERLFTIGPLAAAAQRAFGKGAERFDDAGLLAARIAEGLAPDVTVLVKGSRGMRMERVVAALVSDGG